MSEQRTDCIEFQQRDVESMQMAYGMRPEIAREALRYFGLAGTVFIMQKIEEEGLSASYMESLVLPVRKLIVEQHLSVADISDLFQEHSGIVFKQGFPLDYALAMNGFRRVRSDNIRVASGVVGRELSFEDLDPRAHKQVGNILGECHNDSYAPIGGNDEDNYGVTKMNKE